MPPARVLTRGVYGSRRPRTPTLHRRQDTPTSPCSRCMSHSSASPASTSPRPAEAPKTTSSQPDFQTVFARPTWSVASLLPAQQPSSQQGPITSKTLHHLLRLSSLPPPSSPQEESSMLQTLHTQLHFVRDVQSVDTTAVAPLRAIRDETSAGMAESTVTLDSLREALGRENVIGYRRRPRRDREGQRAHSEEEISVEAATRGQRERGYYLVDKGKAKGGE